MGIEHTIMALLAGALIGSHFLFMRERIRRRRAVMERESLRADFHLKERVEQDKFFAHEQRLLERIESLMDAATAAEKKTADERAEVKRLTNVIIQMKQARHELPPEATDERWGKHIVDEVAYDQPKEEDETLERDIAAFDAEVTQEVGRSLHL